MLPSLVTGLPAAFVVAICSGLPLLWIIGALIFATPAVRAELHITSFRAQLLARTVGYNGLAAVIAAAMGLPAGLVLGRGRGLASRALWLVLPAALLLPSLAYAYGWSQFLRLVGWYLMPAGTADTLRCIWSLAAWLWAVPAVLVGLALRRMDSAVQQQAVLDGALRRITLRQLLPAVLVSLAIVTVLATQEFAVYEPTGISVVATEVRMVFDTGAISSADNPIAGPPIGGNGIRSPDQPARAAAAVATAIPLLVITAVLVFVVAWFASRSLVSETVNVEPWPRALDVSRPTVLLAWALVLLNVVLPIVSLVASLRTTFSGMRIWNEFRPQVTGAIIVAMMAAALATVAAFSASGRWTRGLLFLSAASFLIGGQLLAIADIRVYNRPGLIWAYDAFPVPVIAYIGRFGWLALAAALGSWTRPWRELRAMASVDGASTWQSATAVVWPLAWPLLVAGGLLVGALSMTEVPATVLLFPQNPQVLTPMLMTWVHTVHYDPMIEASLIMMLAVLAPACTALVLIWLGLRISRLPRRPQNG